MTSSVNLTSQTTALRDITTHQVWSDAEGPVVVLLHGLAESARSWAGIQQRLTGFRTVAVELRGHGSTSTGEADGSLQQLSGDLIEFLATVTGPAHVVGFSLGGTIALDAAASRPDLFERIVAVATSSVVGRTAVDFYHARIALVESGDADEIRRALREDTKPAVVQDVDMDALVQSRVDAIGDGSGYVNAARAMAQMGSEPLTPRLNEITRRVDIVAADQDNFCPRKAAEILISGLPDAHYHEIAGAGHLIAVDQEQALATTLASILGSAD